MIAKYAILEFYNIDYIASYTCICNANFTSLCYFIIHFIISNVQFSLHTDLSIFPQKNNNYMHC